MRSAPIKVVLLDLDGTLADTAPDLAAAANRLREEAGLAPLPPARLRPFTSSGVRGMLRAAFDLTPECPGYAQLAERFLGLYANNLCDATVLFDGMDEVLARLEAASIKWGIVTNKRAQYTQPLVAALGLNERACCVVSGDSAARPKPAPDTLLLACRQLGVGVGECVYVGDDLRDVQAGQAVGMRTVAAAYGYLGEDLPIERWGADAIIHAPLDLPPLIDL